MEPLVSVIIPVYNVLPYLREALDSVINQTYKNLEILIVDDGSTDGSGEICDEYLSDPRVVVIHQENKGLSGARNTGLDRMTGEYVAFLDSDDAFMPEMIEKMLDALIRSETYAAMCGYNACWTRGHMNNTHIRKESYALFKNEIVFSSAEVISMLPNGQACWAVWNKLYSKTVWEEIRFPEGVNFEDMQIMCQILEKCKQVVAIPHVFVCYRQRKHSISNAQSRKALCDYLIATTSVEEYIKHRLYVVFPPKILISFQEQFARLLIKRYAALLYSSYSPDSLAIFRNEITIRLKYLKNVHCQFHSKVVFFLFLHIPSLILPFGTCWELGKRLLGTIQIVLRANI